MEDEHQPEMEQHGRRIHDNLYAQDMFVSLVVNANRADDAVIPKAKPVQIQDQLVGPRSNRQRKPPAAEQH